MQNRPVTREGNRLGISETGRDEEGEILEDACGLTRLRAKKASRNAARRMSSGQGQTAMEF